MCVCRILNYIGGATALNESQPMRRVFASSIALATAAVTVLTVFGTSSAGAAAAKHSSAAPYASGDIEVSSQRRRARRARGPGPGFGAFVAMVGTIAAIAATNSRRRDEYPVYSYGYPPDAYYDDNPFGYYNDDYAPGYVVPPAYTPGYRRVAPRVFAPRGGGGGHFIRGGGGGHIVRGGGDGGHARGGGGGHRR